VIHNVFSNVEMTSKILDFFLLRSKITIPKYIFGFKNIFQYRHSKI